MLYILQEFGDKLLLESGDKLLLEGIVGAADLGVGLDDYALSGEFLFSLPIYSGSGNLMFDDFELNGSFYLKIIMKRVSGNISITRNLTGTLVITKSIVREL